MICIIYMSLSNAENFDFNANLLEYLFVDNAKEKYNDILELREKHNYKTAFDLMQIENILFTI